MVSGVLWAVGTRALWQLKARAGTAPKNGQQDNPCAETPTPHLHKVTYLEGDHPCAVSLQRTYPRGRLARGYSWPRETKELF